MKPYIYILCIITFLSCNQERKVKVDKDKFLIEKYLSEDEENLSLYSYILIFCEVKDEDKIGYMSVGDLYKELDNNSLYKTNNSHDFIDGVFNRKVVFDCSQMQGCFVLNDTITFSYNSNSFFDFLQKYGRKIGHERYEIRSDLSYNSCMTVLYYLFLNNYSSSFDDYIGYYYAEKTPSPQTLEKKIEYY